MHPELIFVGVLVMLINRLFQLSVFLTVSPQEVFVFTGGYRF
jgi:hypothetical protein